MTSHSEIYNLFYAQFEISFIFQITSTICLITNIGFILMMINVDAIYRRVKNWLTESNNRFSVQELQDNDSYFFFLVNTTDREHEVIPLAISFPKYRINEIECVCLTLRWDIDRNSGMITAILNDPQMTNQFVVYLKNKLDPTKYELQILPNEQDIKTIKISRTLPVVTLQREYLIEEITNIWMQYRQYLLAVNLCFGMSTLARPEDYR
ncbi:MAG: hypothetical protein WB511_03075 [Nitrososphaeraceae archaeon]